jgi:lipoprotein-anchoring transpeptidase ErfK/SrfK
MLNRRNFVLGAAAMLVTSPAFSDELDPQFQRQGVHYSEYPPGTVVVDPANFFLYYVTANGLAIRYGVGVGKEGLGFSGVAIVGRKAEWPRWRPSANMISRSPEKFAGLAKGIRGGPGNPLGARALYLYRDGKDTRYRIHGTNEPSSIGHAVSNGCIRMTNDQVIDLYGRVKVGSPVVVLACDKQSCVSS